MRHKALKEQWFEPVPVWVYLGMLALLSAAIAIILVTFIICLVVNGV